MNWNPLGASREAEVPFLPDRIVAWCVRTAVGVSLTLVLLAVGWLPEAQRGDLSRLWSTLSPYWPNYLTYLMQCLTVVWMSFGLAQNLRWPLAGFALVSLVWLPEAAARGDYVSLASLTFMLVYGSMRLWGSLGPRPVERERRSTLYRPDVATAGVNLALIAIGFAIWARGCLTEWDRARETTAAARLGMSQAVYALNVVLAVWVTTHLARSRSWALTLMALLDVSWLGLPIQRMAWFHIVGYGSVLVYCVARLSGLLGPKPPDYQTLRTP